MHLFVKLGSWDASSLFLCFLVKLMVFWLHIFCETRSHLYFARDGFRIDRVKSSSCPIWGVALLYSQVPRILHYCFFALRSFLVRSCIHFDFFCLDQLIACFEHFFSFSSCSYRKESALVISVAKWHSGYWNFFDPLILSSYWVF